MRTETKIAKYLEENVDGRVNEAVPYSDKEMKGICKIITKKADKIKDYKKAGAGFIQELSDTLDDVIGEDDATIVFEGIKDQMKTII